MGNPQESQELELAWLAGMLNGDGCFFLNLRTTKGSTLTSEIRLTLTQTDTGLVEYAGSIIKRLTGHFPHLHVAQPHGNGKRPIHHLKVMRSDLLLQIIPRILPYMHGEKQVKAKLLLAFIESRRDRLAPYRIRDDRASLKIAEMFYAACQRQLPSHVTALLNDYMCNTPKG